MQLLRFRRIIFPVSYQNQAMVLLKDRCSNISKLLSFYFYSWKYPKAGIQTMPVAFGQYKQSSRFSLETENKWSNMTVLTISDFITWYLFCVCLRCSYHKLLSEYWYKGNLGKSRVVIQGLQEEEFAVILWVQLAMVKHNGPWADPCWYLIVIYFSLNYMWTGAVWLTIYK